MKKINILVAALASVAIVACCDNSPKTISGTIYDATMNNVTVKELVTDSIYTFSTMDADMSQANGLFIGSPVTVEYKGKLKSENTALKVATDKTYSEALGQWTMPDPINPDSLSMGVEIMVEGAAQSINMATMVYNAWELQGEADKIILKGQSIGNGQTIDFTQTGVISKNADSVYILTIEGTETVYTKVNEM